MHNARLKSSYDASRRLGVRSGGRQVGVAATLSGADPHLSGLKRTATHTLFFCEPLSPSYCTICVMAANYRLVGSLGACERRESPKRILKRLIGDPGCASGPTRKAKAKADTRRPFAAKELLEHSPDDTPRVQNT